MNEVARQLHRDALAYMAEHPAASYSQAMYFAHMCWGGPCARDTQGDEIYPGDTVKLPNGKTYTVQNGDTLSGIAQSNGTTTDALLKANPELSGGSSSGSGGSSSKSGSSKSSGGKKSSKKAAPTAAEKKAAAAQRSKILDQMANLDPDSDEYRKLEQQEQALKMAELHEQAMAWLAEHPGRTYEQALRFSVWNALLHPRGAGGLFARGNGQGARPWRTRPSTDDFSHGDRVTIDNPYSALHGKQGNVSGKLENQNLLEVAMDRGGHPETFYPEELRKGEHQVEPALSRKAAKAKAAQDKLETERARAKSSLTPAQRAQSREVRNAMKTRAEYMQRGNKVAFEPFKED